MQWLDIVLGNVLGTTAAEVAIAIVACLAGALGARIPAVGERLDKLCALLSSKRPPVQ